ncbi:MAG TPA: GDSL-type esterase/lipase family protein [Polyangiaceae bacterium]|nr:GDSL-type esterase/lipase family protein [Polyangiaceae bacterium]
MACGRGGSGDTTSGSSGAGGSSTGGAAGVSASAGGTGGSAATSSSGGASAGTSTAGGRRGASVGGATSAAGANDAGNVSVAQGGASVAGTSGRAQGGAGRTQSGGGAGGAAVHGGGAGGSGAAGAGGQAGAGTHQGSWRIMPLGDSITGTTCYPQLLAQKLKDAGHTNFSFVGTNLNDQSCTDGTIMNAPNVMTEGHGGYILSCLTGDYTSNCSSKGMPSELASWLAAKPPPDVVLLHFGTNDVWNGIATSTITTAYTHLLASLRGANPNIGVFIAQILPMHPDGCTDATTSCPINGVKALNAAIPAWAASASTAASPVYVVNVYASVGDETMYMPNSDLTSDGVHPNAKGSGLVADTWLQALAAQGIP